MTPSSTAHQRLHSALLTAFPTRSSLAALVHYGLGHNLEAIAGGTTLNDWVFTLIDWVAAHGQIPALLGAALGARPTDATFQTLVAELGAVHPPSGTASQLALLTSPDLPSRAIPVIPQQLRPAVPDFKGRAPEIDQLVAALRNATSDKSINCGIWGMTGVGKTELAYAAANRVLDRFPDGQILLQLRGTNPNPMTIEKAWNQVITRFVDDTTIPSDSGEIEALYHSVLATRRVLILADNAQDIHQVRALVPPGGNALIITGQTQFLLPGMVIVRLGMLTPEEATALVLDICPRIDLLASRIAQLCGYLPLALRAVASLLLVDAHRSIAHYVQLLEETHVSLARMRVPGDPNLDVEAALNLSYNALTKRDQEVLKKLSVFSASFNLVAASTLLDPATDIEPWPQGLLGSLRSATWSVETEDQVSPLLQRNLLQWDAATQRYSMHDLIRNFVRDQMTELEAIQVARRYARHYAIVATLAMQFHAGDIGDDRETPMASMYQVLGGRVVAGLVLLNEERPHIDAGWVWASIHAGTPEVDQLLVLYAAALSQVGAVRYDVQTEMLTKLQQGVAAARRLRNYPDLVEYARMEKSLVASLGAVYAEIGTTLRAAQLYKEALDLAVADEDHRMVGMLAGSLGEIAEVASDYGQAAKLFNQSLLLLRRVGDRAREAIALYNLGNLCIRLNKLDASLGYYKKALDISEEVDDPRQKAATLSGLGRCYLLQNEVDKSISYLQEAFNLLYSIGDWPAAAKVLANLGDSYAAKDNIQEAIGRYEAALTLFRRRGARLEEQHILLQLGGLYGNQRNFPRAFQYTEEALAVAKELEDTKSEFLILETLLKNNVSHGDLKQAIVYGEQALALAQRHDSAPLHIRALFGIGQVYQALNDFTNAFTAFEDARSIVHKLGDHEGDAVICQCMADLLIQQGDNARAISYLEMIVAYKISSGSEDMEEYKHKLQELRNQLENTE